MEEEVQKHDLVISREGSFLVPKGVIGKVLEIDGNLCLVHVRGDTSAAVIWAARHNWRVLKKGLKKA